MKTLKIIHDIFKINNKDNELQSAQITYIESSPNLDDIYIYYNYLNDSNIISFTESEELSGYVDDYVADYFI